MSKIDYQALREKAEKATKGSYIVGHTSVNQHGNLTGVFVCQKWKGEPGGVIAECHVNCLVETDVQAYANAEFIAALIQMLRWPCWMNGKETSNTSNAATRRTRRLRLRLGSCVLSLKQQRTTLLIVNAMLLNWKKRYAISRRYLKPQKSATQNYKARMHTSATGTKNWTY